MKAHGEPAHILSTASIAGSNAEIVYSLNRSINPQGRAVRVDGGKPRLRIVPDLPGGPGWRRVGSLTLVGDDDVFMQ